MLLGTSLAVHSQSEVFTFEFPCILPFCYAKIVLDSMLNACAVLLKYEPLMLMLNVMSMPMLYSLTVAVETTATAHKTSLFYPTIHGFVRVHNMELFTV